MYQRVLEFFTGVCCPSVARCLENLGPSSCYGVEVTIGVEPRDLISELKFSLLESQQLSGEINDWCLNPKSFGLQFLNGCV